MICPEILMRNDHPQGHRFRPSRVRQRLPISPARPCPLSLCRRSTRKNLQMLLFQEMLFFCVAACTGLHLKRNAVKKKYSACTWTCMWAAGGGNAGQGSLHPHRASLCWVHCTQCRSLASRQAKQLPRLVVPALPSSVLFHFTVRLTDNVFQQ